MTRRQLSTFKAAYRALVKARAAHDAWVHGILAGKAVNKVKGTRLAKNVERRMLAFMVASKPFLYWL